jgi:putative membrane protein
MLLAAQSDQYPASKPSTTQSGSASSDTTSNPGSRTSTLTASDQKFVREAAQGGLAEVELGKLAAEKASSDDVKKFGQRMADEHGKANDELKQVASKNGIQLPTDLDSKDKALKARLSKLSGTEFDKAYMQNMVKDHEKDVADFRKESTSGSNSDVKQFATETLPTLEDHLTKAHSVSASAGSAASGQ